MDFFLSVFSNYPRFIRTPEGHMVYWLLYCVLAALLPGFTALLPGFTVCFTRSSFIVLFYLELVLGHMDSGSSYY